MQWKLPKATFVVRVAQLFLGCAMLSVLIYTVTLGRINFQFTSNQIETNARSLCYSVAKTLEANIEKMNHTAIVLLNRPEVPSAVRLLQQENLTYEQMSSAWSTLSIQSLIASTTSAYYHVGFYDKDGLFLEGNNPSPSIFENPRLENGMYFNEHAYLTLSPTEHTFTLYDGTAPYILVRAIGDLHSANAIGYVTIMCPPEIFNHLIEDSYHSFDPNKLYPFSLFIEDADGNVIVSTTNDEQAFLLDDTNSHKVSHAMDSADWNVCLRIPSSYYSQQFYRTLWSSAVLPTLLAIVCCGLLIVILARYLRPLRELTNSMKRVEKGNYNERICETTNFTDIDSIFNGYNHMVEQIDTLIHSVYLNKITMQEYQLKLLKAQINPHFLYNTLQTIESYGEIHNVPQVQEIASLLGELLHYNLRERERVYLKDEIRSAETYLKIHQLRFEEHLKFFVQVEPSLEYCIVEKFILQPLIENSILHGFENMSRFGEISICCYREDETLIIDLYDNGVGIPKDRLSIIKAELSAQTGSLETTHIGIINVHKRIVNLYGEPHGVTIVSTSSHGTLLRITLPYTQ